MLVRLVGVDDPVGMIRVLRAELLEVGQELEPRVAECEVHVGGAVGDPLGLRGAHGRVQDREVAPAVAAAHHAHQTLGGHVEVVDAGRFLLQAPEDLAGLRRVVVGEDRLHPTWKIGAMNPWNDLAPNASATYDGKPQTLSGVELASLESARDGGSGSCRWYS